MLANYKRVFDGLAALASWSEPTDDERAAWLAEAEREAEERAATAERHLDELPARVAEHLARRRHSLAAFSPGRLVRACSCQCHRHLNGRDDDHRAERRHGRAKGWGGQPVARLARRRAGPPRAPHPRPRAAAPLGARLGASGTLLTACCWPRSTGCKSRRAP